MSNEQSLYVVQRPDGVRSKKWSRSRIIRMFEAGKIPVSSVVISDTGKKTDIELFAFLAVGEEPVVKPKPVRPRAKQRPVEPKPPPTPAPESRLEPSVRELSVEKRISGDGLTAEAVLQFVNGLPHRDVVVNLPTGQITQRFDLFLSAVRSFPLRDIVLDFSGRLALCEMKKKDGWLAVTFNPMFQLAVLHLQKSPTELPPAKILQKLYTLSNRFLIADEVGLSFSDLRSLVPQFIEVNNSYLHFESPSRWARIFVDDPVLDLKEALREWSKDPGFIATRFIGGGFGFKGAVKGMLMAGAMNMFVDSMNDSINREWQKKLSQPLYIGANKLCVTREIAAYYLKHGQ